jgi:hypothetical protein
MKPKILIFMSSLLAIAIVHASAFAKGDTVKITLTKLDSGTRIESTDYEAVKRFGVWDGPGTFVNGVESKEGFIIAWPQGAIAAPSTALQRYEVRFYESCKMSERAGCRTEEPSVVCVVQYVYDPATRQGYVHLPGSREEFWELNTRSILRGIEGNWFLASEEWQGFVLPLLARLL